MHLRKGGSELDGTNTTLSYRPDDRFLSCKTDCILSCGEKLNGRTRPVQLDTEGAVSVVRNASVYAQAGWYFSVTNFFQIPNDGLFLAFVFENPPDNNKLMYLDQVAAGLFVSEVTGERIGNEETLELLIADQPRIELIRQTLIPQNNLIGSPDTSTLIVRTVGAADLNRIRFDALYPDGKVNQEFEGQIILPPGNNLLVFLDPFAENISTAVLVATVRWWELPVKEEKKKKKSVDEKDSQAGCAQGKSDH